MLRSTARRKRLFAALRNISSRGHAATPPAAPDVVSVEWRGADGARQAGIRIFTRRHHGPPRDSSESCGPETEIRRPRRYPAGSRRPSAPNADDYGCCAGSSLLALQKTPQPPLLGAGSLPDVVRTLYAGYPCHARSLRTSRFPRCPGPPRSVQRRLYWLLIRTQRSARASKRSAESASAYAGGNHFRDRDGRGATADRLQPTG